MLGGEEQPHSLEGVHPEGHPHPRAVRQEGSQSGFLQEPEDQDLVPGREQETEGGSEVSRGGGSFMVDDGRVTSMGKGSLAPDMTSGKGLF